MTNDAISFLPGTMVMPTLAGADVVSIRGYSTNLSVRGIATLLDGVPLNSLAWGTAFYDKANINLGVLDRIEMVRGPGSTIYGSDAFHGVYSLKSFSSENDVLITGLEEGSIGYHSGHLRISRGIGEGWRVNSAISINNQEDQNRPYLYTDPVDGIRKYSARAHRYDSHTLIAKLDNSESKYYSAKIGLYHHVFNSQDNLGLGTARSAGNDLTDGDTQFTMFSGGFTRHLNNQISLEASLFYWENKHTYLYKGYDNLYQQQDEYRAGLSLIAKQPYNTLNTQWLIGIGKNRAEIIETGLGFLPIVNLAPFDGLERTIDNLFIQTKTALIDETLLILFGFRIDDYSDFGKQASPRAGVIYKPNKASAIKLLYGNAFRAAVGGELTSAGFIIGRSDIKPEVIDTYELIYVVSTSHSKLSATLFSSEWKDGIIIEPLDYYDEFFISKYANRGENKSIGFELEGLYQIDNCIFEGSVSYVTSESVSIDLDYGAFPKYIANIGFNYELRQYKLNFYLSERIHLDVKDRPANSALDSPEDLKDYFRTDLNVRYEYNQDTDIEMNIRNLFNRQNYLPALWEGENGIPEQGVNATLRITYKM